MIKYPEKFIKECKELFPNWVELHNLLMEGSPMVGKYLCDACGLKLDEDMIISAFRNKKSEKVLEAAKRAKLIRNIYQEWYKLIDHHENEMAKKHGYSDCI